MASKKASKEEAVALSAVIERALAYLCLHAAGLLTKPKTDQWKLLKALGLSAGEAGGLLGTTGESLLELERQATKGKGQRKGDRRGKGKTSRRR